jgi:hypothetical protein
MKVKVNVRELVHNHLVNKYGSRLTAVEVLAGLANRNDGSTSDLAVDVATELTRTNGTYIRSGTVERRIREFKEQFTVAVVLSTQIVRALDSPNLQGPTS